MDDITPEEAKEAEETEIVLGFLPFTVNGIDRKVPERKWRANREWVTHMKAKFASVAAAELSIATPEGQWAMADMQRELVLDYDSMHALGDLEDATEREIDVIYNKLQVVAFPLAESATAIVMDIIRTAAVLAQASSTNGPSPTGASEAPTILKDHLPTAKSSSSTRRRRSA